MNIFKALALSVKDSIKYNYLYHSASLTYSFLLAVAPLFIVLISLASYLPIIDLEQIEFFLLQTFPEYTHKVISEILEVRSRAKETSLIAFLSSYFFSVNFLKNLNYAVRSVTNDMLGFQRTFIMWIIFPLLLIGGSILLSVAFAITVYIKVFFPVFITKLIDLFYFLPGTLLLTLFYMSLYKRRRLLFVVFVSFTVSLGISLFQLGFTWYLSSLYRGNVLYGSLTSIIVFLLWVNASFYIFLLGSRLIYRHEKV